MILSGKMHNINIYRQLYTRVQHHFLPKRLKSSSVKLKYQCEHLKRRALIKLTGSETLSFLQGLVTNDVRHLENNHQTSVTLPCLYTAFLNQQGRLLYDSILYRFSNSSESSFLLECDSSICEGLIKHMKLYRVRKKIDITPMVDKLNILAVFPSSNSEGQLLKPLSPDVPKKFDGKDAPVIVTEDPRHAGLGYRYILPNDYRISDILQFNQDLETFVDGEYAKLRYKMGIGEGIEDHPPGKCFPLESNLDFLHGVSFHKGCYIGQELTARTHHTGVVRKRLMPVKILQENNVKIPPESIIVNENGTNVGKFRGQEGHYGLALLRVTESLNSKHLVVKETNIELSTTKPFWWPRESSKTEKGKTTVER